MPSRIVLSTILFAGSACWCGKAPSQTTQGAAAVAPQPAPQARDAKSVNPEDLWAACGDGVMDEGENLLTCREDVTGAHRAHVQTVDGTPVLRINEARAPLLGVYVYNPANVEGHVPTHSEAWLPFEKAQIDNAASHGITFISVKLRLQDLYRGPTPPKAADIDAPDNWDYGRLDTVMDYAAQQGLYVMLSVNTSMPPPWWKKANPDAMQLDDDGRAWAPVTFNNPAYHESFDAMMAPVIAHFRQHPALLAWNVRVGVTGENNYGPNYVVNIFDPPDSWCDYSPQAQARFRSWLEQRYGSTSALREAWGDRGVSLQTAEIPRPKEKVEIEDMLESIKALNGAGDTRRPWYDWMQFRLEEKSADTRHFLAMFRQHDPDHLIVGVPAFAPLIGNNTPRSGRQDGDTWYHSPNLDAILHHPRVAHTDRKGGFNKSRGDLLLTDLHAMHHGKLSVWANEETSEVATKEKQDQDNIWRLDIISAMHAALGQGDGWIGGADHPMIPAWSDVEFDRIHRLTTLYALPGMETPQPEVALLADPFSESFHYYLGGRRVFTSSLMADRKAFVEGLREGGLVFDTLTTEDVRANPAVLQRYKGVLVLNIPRLPQDVAEDLAAYRDAGGGLFVGGRTGVFDVYGNQDTTALETLLDAKVRGQFDRRADKWAFTSSQAPVKGLDGVAYGHANIYWIPEIEGGGYTPLGTLARNPGVVTAGVSGKTVFWFPKLSERSKEGGAHMSTFQRNLWEFFGATPQATAAHPGGFEVYGQSHKALFTTRPQTVDLLFDADTATGGAIVWDWLGMELVGTIRAGGEPTATVTTEAKRTYFLSATPTSAEPAFVAARGGQVGPIAWDGDTLGVALYRTSPEEPVVVAVWPGAKDLRFEAKGAELRSVEDDATGRVRLVTLEPEGERLTLVVRQ